MKKQTEKREPGTGEPTKDGRESALFRQAGILVPLGLLIVLGLFVGVRWLHQHSFSDVPYVTTEDARVKGEPVAVSSSVQGRIRLLSIQEGEEVEAGQVVAQLEEEDSRAQVDMAAAAIRTLEAELKEAETLRVVEQKKARKNAGKEIAALEDARARVERLHRKQRLDGHQSRASHHGYLTYEVEPYSDSESSHGEAGNEDAVSDPLEEARAEIKRREARLKAVKTAMQEEAVREQHIEVLKARLTEARAGLASANLKLSAMTLKSPIKGVVAGKAANVGEVVKPGQTVAFVVSLDHLWVVAPMDESKIGQLRPGQIADLKVKALPEGIFSGTVVDVGESAASGSSFLPENISTDGSTKPTQRIPVRIEVSDPNHLLRPGMIASVKVDLRTGKSTGSAGPGKIELPGKPQGDNQ